MGNLITNLGKLPNDTLTLVWKDLGGVRAPQDAHAGVVAKLTCCSSRTARRVRERLRSGARPRAWRRAAAIGASHEAVEFPECLVGPDEAVCAETSEEEAGLPARLPVVSRRKLETWRTHPQFGLGMHFAELATRWLVNGYSYGQWP